MATLTVRNVPEEVHRKLRVRAAHAGRSMEAEVRAILSEAATLEAPARSAAEVQDWVRKLYRGRLPKNAVDELLAERRREVAAEGRRR